MKEAPPGRAKWEGWLAVLGNEVFTLFLYRRLWRQFIQAAEAAAVITDHGNMFAFFANCYSTRQSVAIRRLCGRQRREHSFRHLLTEIRDNPHLAMHPVAPAEVEADLRALDAGNLARVDRYVDQYLAHKQQTPAASAPTYADIHAAIDELGSLLQKYKVIVEDVHQELEAIVDEDVLGPFRKAWLPPLR